MSKGRDNKGSGGASAPPGPGPSLEDAEEMTLMMFVNSIAAFARHLPEHKVVELAGIMLREQAQLNGFLSDAVDPEKIKLNPVWGIKVIGSDGAIGQVLGPKLPPSNDLQEITKHVMALALVTSPLPRAILRAYGCNYEFVQGSDPDKSNIIVQ